MINSLPNTWQAFTICIAIALYSSCIGIAWGLFGRKVLFRRFADQYTQFDIAAIGLGTLGSLMVFEWCIREPWILLTFHHFQIGGWWVQIWIACFAFGTMSGYRKGKRIANNLMGSHSEVPPILIHRLCADCPYTTTEQEKAEHDAIKNQ